MSAIEEARPIADGVILGDQVYETLPGGPSTALPPLDGAITHPSPESPDAWQPEAQEGPSSKVSHAGAVGARAPAGNYSCHRTGSGSSRGSFSSASHRKSKAYLILSPIMMAKQDQQGVGGGGGGGSRLSQILTSIKQAFRRTWGGGDKKPFIISGNGGGETAIAAVEPPPLLNAAVVDSESKFHEAQDKASVGGCIKALTSGLTKAGGGGGGGTAIPSSVVPGASSAATSITHPPLSSTPNTQQQQDIDPAAISIGGLINAAEVGFTKADQICAVNENLILIPKLFALLNNALASSCAGGSKQE